MPLIPAKRGGQCTPIRYNVSWKKACPERCIFIRRACPRKDAPSPRKNYVPGRTCHHPEKLRPRKDVSSPGKTAPGRMRRPPEKQHSRKEMSSPGKTALPKGRVLTPKNYVPGRTCRYPENCAPGKMRRHPERLRSRTVRRHPQPRRQVPVRLRQPRCDCIATAFGKKQKKRPGIPGRSCYFVSGSPAGATAYRTPFSGCRGSA